MEEADRTCSAVQKGERRKAGQSVYTGHLMGTEVQTLPIPLVTSWFMESGALSSMVLNPVSLA